MQVSANSIILLKVICSITCEDQNDVYFGNQQLLPIHLHVTPYVCALY